MGFGLELMAAFLAYLIAARPSLPKMSCVITCCLRGVLTPVAFLYLVMGLGACFGTCLLLEGCYGEDWVLRDCLAAEERAGELFAETGSGLKTLCT